MPPGWALTALVLPCLSGFRIQRSSHHECSPLKDNLSPPRYLMDFNGLQYRGMRKSVNHVIPMLPAQEYSRLSARLKPHAKVTSRRAPIARRITLRWLQWRAAAPPTTYKLRIRVKEPMEKWQQTWLHRCHSPALVQETRCHGSVLTAKNQYVHSCPTLVTR